MPGEAWPDLPAQSRRTLKTPSADDHFRSMMSSIHQPPIDPSVRDSDTSGEDSTDRDDPEPTVFEQPPAWYPSFGALLRVECGDSGPCNPADEERLGCSRLMEDVHAEQPMFSSSDEKVAQKLPTRRSRPPELGALVVEPFLEQPRKAEVEIAVSTEHPLDEGIGSIGVLPAVEIVLPPLMAAASIGTAFAFAVDPYENSPASQVLSHLINADDLGKAEQVTPREIRVLRMKLMPEELGEVEVVLRHSGSETHIHIFVRSEAAANMLRRDISFLEDRLGSLLAMETAQAITIATRSDTPALTPAFDQHGSSSTTYFGTQSNARDQRPSQGKEDMSFIRKAGSRDDENGLVPSSPSGQRLGADRVV